MCAGLQRLLSYLFGRNAEEPPLESEDPDTLRVHKYSDDPTKAWKLLSEHQIAEKIQLLPFKTPVYKDKVRFVCMSDTHGRIPLQVDIPDGDVLLHAGDFSMQGKPEEVESFNDWLGTLPYKHKIVIAGNHDASLDNDLIRNDCLTLLRHGLGFGILDRYMKEKGLTSMKEVLTNCTYLEDSETSVYGIRVYGSPWQSPLWHSKWGFNLPRGQACLDKWNLIPEGIDILITHGPPVGHGDFCTNQKRAGCVELLHTIQKRVKCKYHVFGHIHEGYGITSDGTTKFINAATCNKNLRPCNQPIIFDMKLPPGFIKENGIMSEEIEGAAAE